MSLGELFRFSPRRLLFGRVSAPPMRRQFSMCAAAKYTTRVTGLYSGVRTGGNPKPTFE